MMRQKKQAGSDDAPGAPEWMVTFSDCMTLLLTFFVLLLSFSSFDERSFHKLKVIFAKSLPKVSSDPTREKSAFLQSPEFWPLDEVDKGSEKPTLEEGPEHNLMEEAPEDDFRRRKVFLVPSRRIFWGKGSSISREGRQVLSIVGAFLKEAPNRVVISENSRGAEKSGETLGLDRAWSVMEFMTAGQKLDKKQFSISATSTITEQALKKKTSTSPEGKEERMLEIVLLERSIYN